MRSVYLAAIVLFSMTACEKTVILKTTPADEKLVIEGLVTDFPGYQYVKVSRSVSFYQTGKTPRVTDATVTVTDDLGTVITFDHNPNAHADSAGYYKPSGFVGEIGRTYTLSVDVDGRHIEATDKLLPVLTLDSLEYQVNEDEEEDPKIDYKFYEVLLYAKEPQDTEDFYLFNFYRNDSLVVYNPNDIYYADDVAIGEEINGIPSPVYYAIGDTARVEAYSLSRVGYIFYNDLSGLLNNDGGMYSPPPANPRTNLSNGAVGFFQVSAVKVLGIKIE